MNCALAILLPIFLWARCIVPLYLHYILGCNHSIANKYNLKSFNTYSMSFLTISSPTSIV